MNLGLEATLYDHSSGSAQHKKRYAAGKTTNESTAKSHDNPLYDNYAAEVGCKAKGNGRYGQGSGLQLWRPMI